MFRPRFANLLRNRTTNPQATRYGRRAFYVATGLGAAMIPTAMMAETIEESLETSPRISSSLSSMSTASIVRSYVVYTACSIPFLIDYAPTLLSSFTNSPIPGLGALTQFIVRHTFFAQFVPGESVAECQPTMLALRSRNIGSLLNYSAEADENSTDVRHLEKQRLDEVYRAIEALGKFENEVEASGGQRGSSAFALKITGLIDPEILARASVTLLRLREQSYSNASSSPKSSPRVAYPGAPQSADAQVVARATTNPNFLFSLKGAITEMGVLESDTGIKEGDLEELATLWGKLKALGAHASENGVKLLIDAEHTWYQPALDAYTLLLAQQYNKPGLRSSGPLVYGTFQSYLNRQPGFLADALKHAEANNYQLGVKLVRGAYFVQERKKWADEGRPGPDPIWIDKPATDKAFNDSVALVIGTMARQLRSSPSTALSVFFGTHNEDSCQLIVDTLKKEGLAQKVKGGWALRDDVMGKVFIAQLYGMKDDLTDQNASAFVPGPMPFASKYIAYGKLNEVMPFLGRRAIENKAVMSGEGGAAAERKRLMAELKRRIFG